MIDQGQFCMQLFEIRLLPYLLDAAFCCLQMIIRRHDDGKPVLWFFTGKQERIPALCRKLLSVIHTHLLFIRIYQAKEGKRCPQLQKEGVQLTVDILQSTRHISPVQTATNRFQCIREIRQRFLCIGMCELRQKRFLRSSDGFRHKTQIIQECLCRLRILPGQRLPQLPAGLACRIK